MNNRFYKFAIVTYLDESDIIETLQRKRTVVRSWAYICHDHEETDKHFHVVLITYDGKSCTAIQKWFPSRQNTFVEKLTDQQAVFDYLTHKNDPDKYQYDVSLIKSDNLMDIRGNRFEAFDRSFDILCDINSGVPLVEMVRRYGRDFIIHYDQYDHMAALVRYDFKETYQPYNKNNREEFTTVENLEELPL